MTTPFRACPANVLAHLPDGPLAQVLASACEIQGVGFVRHDTWSLVHREARTSPCLCIVTPLEPDPMETVRRLSAIAGIRHVPVILCVDRLRVSLPALQEAARLGLTLLFDITEFPTVVRAGHIIEEAALARPGVVVEGLLQHGLELEGGTVAERAVRMLIHAQGRIRTGKELADRMGFSSVRALSRRLRRARLMSAGLLTDWVNALFYVTAIRWAKRSAAELARAAGEEPTALYRRVRRRTGIGLDELAAHELITVLGYFDAARRRYLAATSPSTHERVIEPRAETALQHASGYHRKPATPGNHRKAASDS